MDYVLILSSPFVGLLVGILPAMGMTLTLILMYPILELYSPATLLIFYAIACNSRDFAGSVSALNFGLLGEITSAPALKEKKFITSSSDLKLALRNTAYGSLFGVLVGILFSSIIIFNSSKFPFILRSDFLGAFLLLTVCFLFYYTENSIFKNILLCAVGIIIGSIGFNHYLGREHLTFGNQYLHGGIPTLSLLMGIYGIPKTLSLLNIQIKNSEIVSENSKGNFNWLSSIRGSIVGSICGIIPYIGTAVGSNIAHIFESKIYKTESVNDAMARLTSAETANNASQITVLLPLLLIGVAIQPSELILLDLIDSIGWDGYASTELIFELMIYVVVGCLISTVLCYNFVTKLLNFFKKYLKIIVYVLLGILFLDIIYLGYQADQALYYFVCLLISLLIGLYLHKKNIDAVPLILAFLLEDKIVEVIFRLYQLYL